MALDDAHAGPLPCGALLDDLVAQVTDGSAPVDRAHQAACRYCQAALDSIAEAWEEFQSVARSAVTVPEDLAERIIARIRRLARATGEGVLVVDAEGDTRITDRVLSRLSRSAALSIPGVVIATVLRAHDDPRAPGSVAVALRLVATYGPSLPRIGDSVRSAVVDAVSAQTGADVSRVDVTFEDLVLDDAQSS